MSAVETMRGVEFERAEVGEHYSGRLNMRRLGVSSFRQGKRFGYAAYVDREEIGRYRSRGEAMSAAIGRATILLRPAEGARVELANGATGEIATLEHLDSPYVQTSTGLRVSVKLDPGTVCPLSGERVPPAGLDYVQWHKVEDLTTA